MKWSLLNIKDSKEYICVQLRKYYVLYSVICFIVAAVELFLSIRYISKYTIELNMYLIRFILYVILFLTSLIFGLVIICDHFSKIKDWAIYILIHIYSLVLIVWGAINSYVDIHNGNDVFTYITILVMVGGIVVVHPFFFIPTGVITTLVLVLISNARGLEYFGSGTTINLIIFILFSFILNYQRYMVGSKEYKLQKQLRDLSYIDQLTNVYNRRTLFDKLESIVAGQEGFYIGMIDVDDFKSINDLYGHDVGDEVVIKVAQFIKEYFGEETTFRYGGDEFTVFGFDVDNGEELQLLIKKINQNLASVYQDKHITLSAGFCLTEYLNQDYNEILKISDNALYISKNSGKATTTILKK